MTTRLLIEKILSDIQDESQAEQSAIYMMAYPSFTNLVLCASTGRKIVSERYWKPHFAEANTIRKLQNQKSPIILPEGTITKEKEKTLAIPIVNGDSIIGVVVHCYIGDITDTLEKLHASVQKRVQDLFSCWVEFLIAEQSRPLSSLFNVAGSISSSLDLDRVLLTVVEQATVLFRVKISSLMMVNQKKRELEMLTAYGCSLEYLDKPNVPIDGSILGQVIEQNKVVQVENILQEKAYLHKELAAKEGVASLLAAPISFENNVLGVLNIYSAMPRRWQHSERELLQTFANHAAVAITNARVHEQVLSMEEQLQVSAKLATLGELAAGLAHEIRNPLAVINMLIHSWKGSPPNADDFQHDVDVISQKISDLNTLVSDLLCLAKSRPLDVQTHNIEELVERVLRLLHHRINQQRVTIRKKISLREMLLEIDRERIEQALLNIFLNALDVMPNGGTISVSLYNKDAKFAIEIADSGPGIPKAQMAELFKAFRSTKAKGMGLGLPMTRRIVDEHKGEILVAPNKPNGAKFTILLPINREK